jgi:uncharacterized protein YdbL (DUF1318 family)
MMTMMTISKTLLTRGRSPFRTLLFSVLLALSFSAAAAPLDDAKRAGYVIEIPTGYVEATPEAPASTKALVDDINERRRQAYERIGQRNGITADQVGVESYRKRMGE